VEAGYPNTDLVAEAGAPKPVEAGYVAGGCKKGELDLAPPAGLGAC
jgi:hypothetical protein